MSTSAGKQARLQRADWHMFRALVTIGLLCALVIASVFEFTAPIISQNRTEALEQAIFTLLPDARLKNVYRLTEEGRFEATADKSNAEPMVYACYNEARQLVGFAIEAAGMGYQDTISLLYGYAPGNEAIVGIVVLESRETPGLGARIGTDAAFLRNFERLDVLLTPDKTGLAHPIEVVKAGERSNPWQIEAITGATVSSRAVGRILQQSAEFWIPKLLHNTETFKIGH